MKAYNIVLYPTPGYFLHFLIFEESPIAAINRLNWWARKFYEDYKIKYAGKEDYGKLKELHEIISTTRRYKRKYKPTWAHKDGKACEIHELSENMVYSGQIFFGPARESLVQNLLPSIELS